MPTLAALPAFVTDHQSWFVAGLIVLLGLFVYGLADVIRTRPIRVWAIGGVCFRDAIRRRVLWITPLAMLGIILVSQFQKPFDEFDAVRLTVKVCLFTTGLVVVIIALVTASTNLPREIDNRVVFTIVTKPVTRLEIVLGKIVGFARVSAVILVVMGLFTLAYMHTQSWFLGRQIRASLDSPYTEPTRRAWLQHFSEQGLLQAQDVSRPSVLMQFARAPDGSDGGWVLGGVQDALVHLEYTPKDMTSAAAPDTPGGAGVAFLLRIGYEPVRPDTVKPNERPKVAIQILDPASNSVLLSSEQLGKDAVVELNDPAGNRPVLVAVTPEKAVQLAGLPAINVQVQCASPDFLYHVRTDAVSLIVPDSEKASHTITSRHEPLLRGSSGRSGQQLVGPTHGVHPVAAFVFSDVPPPAATAGRVPFELNVNVDNAGSDTEREIVGTLEVQALDRKTGQTGPVAVVYPESRRTVFFDLPAEQLKDGSFDLLVRNRSNGHTIGMTTASVSVVTGREPFWWNLFKAIFVLWLLAVLTAAVAFWCSTFLSWPIAVVLSTLIILGHWGISNVDLGSGIGSQVATDFFPSNAPVAAVVSTSVEKLSRTLTLIANVLPDITAFGVTDSLERGTALKWSELAAPAEVLLVFGLPLVTLAYVFLRNKEVAP